MSIDQQKEIATEVLKKIQSKYSSAIIAGGAPRDWQFSILASDIDIFVNHKEALNEALHKGISSDEWFEKLPSSKISKFFSEELGYEFRNNKHSHYYFNDGSMIRVLDFSYKGLKFQLILTCLSPRDFVYSFDVSISKIFFDGKDTHKTGEFFKSLYNKTIYLSEDAKEALAMANKNSFSMSSGEWLKSVYVNKILKKYNFFVTKEEKIDIKAIFEEYEDEYLRFERVPLDKRLSKYIDLNALLLLEKLIPASKETILLSSSFSLNISTDKLAKIATKEDIIDLIRCGISYDPSTDLVSL